MTITYQLMIERVDKHERELAEDVAEFSGQVLAYLPYTQSGLPDALVSFTSREAAEAYTEHFYYGDEYAADDAKLYIRQVHA